MNVTLSLELFHFWLTNSITNYWFENDSRVSNHNCVCDRSVAFEAVHKQLVTHQVENKS